LALGLLGLMLTAVWAALALLARRAPGRSLPLALAAACGGAGITAMYSSYLTGGQLGLPLAAALAGAALASPALKPPFQGASAIGVGTVGLFSLLIMGHFFGDLTTPHALLLLGAPLLCWLPEFPYACRLAPKVRGVLRVLLVAVPVSLAVVQAQQPPPADDRTPSSPTEPTPDDYKNSGQ
jgi:hypothetical protein